MNAKPYPVTVKVFDQEKYDGDWPSDNMREAIEWFQQKLASVPEEYRDSACLNIDSVSGYEGSHYASMVISYSRPATADDVAERERRQRAFQEAEMERARAVLARYEKSKAQD